MTASDGTGSERSHSDGSALVPRVDAPVGAPVPKPDGPAGTVRDVSMRIRAARWIAFGADVLQILLLPAFFAGELSPINGVLDVVVAVVLVSLLGWHPALLPTFIAELIPFVDLLPTWTAAVLFVTRRRA